jgi:hypothetical protein
MTRAAPFALAAFVLAPCSALAEAPRLGLPLSCEIGKTCWVQQYADHDPSGAVKDYACGSQTYDGHDGTDIRVRDATSIADVIAAAAGTVKAVRDGVGDRLIRSEADREAVVDRECGNGVLISHGDGWETQYCHLRQGSVSVKAGDTISLGQKLGEVGYSGMAEFPHVHLALRKDGKNVDPFRSAGGDAGCGAPQNPLWTDEVLAALTYNRSNVIGQGFAPGAVKLQALEDGTIEAAAPTAGWPAMVAYMWAINLEKGDTITVTFDGPDGISAMTDVTLDRAKAQYMLFAGKKRPAGGWPKGLYRGRVVISNAGTARISQEWQSAIQ